MLEIFINGIKKEVPEGTMVLDLLPDFERTNYLVCQINNQIKELRFCLTEKHNGAHIEFKGLEIMEGGKAYEASPKYRKPAIGSADKEDIKDAALNREHENRKILLWDSVYNQEFEKL